MLNFNLNKYLGSLDSIKQHHKIMKKNVIIKLQNSGFKILSSILRLSRSIIKNTKAPLKDIIIILKGIISFSNNHNANRLTPNEARKPEMYPIIVLLLFFGKWYLPKLTPIIEAAPSPMLVINAAAVKIPKGRNSSGTSERINTKFLVNS